MKKIVLVCIACVIGVLFIGSNLRLTYSSRQIIEQQQTSCAQSGERIGAQGTPEQCCQGLIPMSGYGGGYTGECAEQEPMGGVFICSACGNSICDVNNLENKCNCPKDCE